VSQPNDASLYEGLPPDATVDSVEEDPGNPGWAFVRFSDGRESTLPTETAMSMPQTPPAYDPMTGAVPPGSYGEIGPPPPPAGGPMGFGPAPELAPEAPPGAPPVPEGFAPVPPVDPSARPGVVPAGPNVARGDSFRPEGAVPGSSLAMDAATVGSGSSQYPADGGMAAIAQPATPGGFAPFSTTEGETRGADVTADSPEEMSGRLGEAVGADAEAAYTRDLAAYDASVGAKHLAAGQLMEHEAELQRQRREHELTQQEHARIIDGIEKNPIDEDGFWTSGPGRRGAAWVALALSGFLQGASRGANPMLNQMMGAFQNAQSSWMQNQRAERDSVLRRRTAAMGDERAAISSLDMQLNGIMTKYIQLQSDAAGVPPPPGLATYVAERQLKMAEKQNEIGRIVTERVQNTLQSEARATPAQPALRRGDVVLRDLGLDQKAIQSAWDPNDGNVPGAVQAATKLESIAEELKAIRAKYEGSLPQQALFSYNTFGAAPFAGRLGSEAAQDQVRAKALMLEAQQMVKQSAGTTKLFDSNQERDDLIKTLDTGEPDTTMRAIEAINARANENAIAAAQRYTRDPQGLINFVRESRGETRGVDPGDSPVVSRVLKRGAPPAAPAAGAPAAPGGADAAAPLAPPGAPPPGTPAPPSGPGPATPTTASLRGTYRALRASRLNAPR
jgi:hypothetical protein